MSHSPPTKQTPNIVIDPLLAPSTKNGAIKPYTTYTSTLTSCNDQSSNLDTKVTKPSPNQHSLPQRGGTSTIFGVYQNFLNALVGAGILGIPSVYSMCGIYGGILLMFLFAALSTYTINLLIVTAQFYNVTEYEELGYITYGSMGYLLAASALLLLDFGTCLNYLIILGDSSFKVLQIWGYHSLLDRQLTILVVAMCVIFPPCLWRDISFYEKFSGIKIVGIVLVVAVVVYQYIVLSTDRGSFAPNRSETDLWNISGIPSAVGIVAYCFVAHDTAFLYYNTLLNPTKWRWTQTVLLSIGSAMILSLVLSIPAYLTFGNQVDGNVLNNYQVTQASIVVTRIVYVIMMALTFPTSFFVVRHVCYAGFCRMLSLIKIQCYRYKRKKTMSMMNASAVRSEHSRQTLDEDVRNYSFFLYRTEYNVKNAPLYQHLISTCVLFAIPLVLSMYVLDLGVVMSIIGNLSSVNLAFILPCITWIKASKYGFLSFCKEDGWRKKYRAWMEIYPPALLTLLGIFIAVYGVVDTLRTSNLSKQTDAS